MSATHKFVLLNPPVAAESRAVFDRQISWMAQLPYAPSTESLERSSLALALDGYTKGLGPVVWLALNSQEEVDGVLLGARQFEWIDLEYLAVRKEKWGMGIAKALVQRFHSDCKSWGAERVLLEVASGNANARFLYEQAGYSLVHLRPRYYRTGEDALVMEARL